MSVSDLTPPTVWPRRRLARWAGIAVAVVAAGLAAWYFGIKLPDEREAVEAARLRATNARTIPGLNLDLVYVAPGSFLMGTPEQSLLAIWYYTLREKGTKQPNPEADPNTAKERPATWVTLTKPFWLGRTPVTQGQYEAVMGENPSSFKAAGRGAPVESVSWDDAMAFCDKLTERERAAGRLPTGYAYSLPTEAQREYAARAGSTGFFTEDVDAMEWYVANSGKTTHPAGTKQPNAWGLCDMQGNVGEWCRDWYGNPPGGEVTNPTGPSTGSICVVRGGGWYLAAKYLRPALRGGFAPNYRGSQIGFRLALEPSLTK